MIFANRGHQKSSVGAEIGHQGNLPRTLDEAGALSQRFQGGKVSQTKLDEGPPLLLPLRCSSWFAPEKNHSL